MASKVTAILMAFTDRAVLSLTEIAGIAELPTSTAHRLASELLAWRMLERTENGGYRIGLPLRIIGKDVTDIDAFNRALLVMRARPVLAELARTARTEVKLGALNGHQVVYLSHFRQPTDRGGARDGGMDDLAPTLPASATAMGRALLAFSPTSVVESALAQGPPTADPVTSPDDIRHALSVVRLTQIATARDVHHRDKSTIAMPVFAGGGTVAAAVELTVVEPVTDVKAAMGALTVACRSLSRQLATELPDRGSH